MSKQQQKTKYDELLDKLGIIFLLNEHKEIIELFEEEEKQKLAVFLLEIGVEVLKVFTTEKEEFVSTVVERIFTYIGEEDGK